MTHPYEHDVRPLVRRLGKPPAEWQRDDLVELCLGEGICVLNFRYAALDGKLKELRLPVTDRATLERLLAAGERVDGSSLFPGLFDTRESDLYVLPVYRWAFQRPWAPDELDLVCRFADRHGELARTPENVLAEAARRFRESSGAELDALAELEFYLFTRPDHGRFSSKTQRNYHQTSPYLDSRAIADEILRTVSAVTGRVKYCHSEVGYVDLVESDDPEIDGCRAEQHELEFDLMPVEDLGAWLTVARWLVRAIAHRHGATATFLPKLEEGVAGSGMHLHLAVRRDGRNAMTDEAGELSPDALGLIGGLLEHAVPMTAFGSTVAASFLRLVPGQEAPTRVCWGRRNRASLVRVPLDFGGPRLDRLVNPGERGDYPAAIARPTIEYRSPDGSAFPLLLLAAVTACAEAGLSSAASLELAARLEARPDRAHETFEELPGCAVAAAHALRDGRTFFEERGFPPRLIDFVVGRLEAELDDGLAEALRALPAIERLRESRRLMHKDLHKH